MRRPGYSDDRRVECVPKGWLDWTRNNDSMDDGEEGTNRGKEGIEEREANRTARKASRYRTTKMAR